MTYGRPTLGAAFGGNYTDSPKVYTDISNRLRENGYTAKRGKQQDLGKFQPGRLTASLDNRDRAFSQKNASSPWFGQVAPEVFIQAGLEYPWLPGLALDGGMYGTTADVSTAVGTMTGMTAVRTPGSGGAFSDIAPRPGGAGTPRSMGRMRFTTTATNSGTDIFSVPALDGDRSIPITAGKTYTLTARVRCVTKVSTSPQAFLTVSFYDPTKLIQSTPTSTGQTHAAAASETAWSWIWNMTTAPVGTAFLVARIGFNGSTTGDVWDLSCLVVDECSGPVQQPLWTGQADDWAPDLDMGDAKVTMSAQDTLKSLGRNKIASLGWDTLVKSTASPTTNLKAFYRLNGADPSTYLADNSGNNAPPLVLHQQSGQTIVPGFPGAEVADADSAIQVASSFVAVGGLSYSDWTYFLTGAGSFDWSGTWTIGCWARLTGLSSGRAWLLSNDPLSSRSNLNTGGTAANPRIQLGLACQGLASSYPVSAWAYLGEDITGGGNALTLQDGVSASSTVGGGVGSPTTVTAYDGKDFRDGTWHLLALRKVGTTFTLNVDGVDTATHAAAGTPTFVASPYIGLGFPNNGQNPHVIDDAFFFQQNVTAAQLLAIYNKGLFPGYGQDWATQIGVLLDAAQWPTAERDLDTSSPTKMQTFPTSIIGQSCLTYAQVLEQAEQGMLFSREDGRIKAISRQTRMKQQTAVAVFGVGTGEVRISDASIATTSGAMVNDQLVTRVGSEPERWTDQPSVTKNGYIAGQPINNMPYLLEQDSLSLAQYLVNTTKGFDSRITSITLDLQGAEDALWQQRINRKIGDLIEVRLRPVGITPGTYESYICRIISLEDRVTHDGWKFLIGTTASEVQGWLVMDSATLGKLDTASMGW